MDIQKHLHTPRERIVLEAPPAVAEAAEAVAEAAEDSPAVATASKPQDGNLS